MVLVSTYFLSTLIRFARTRAKLTQRDLAERCEVAQPCIVGWESGERSINEKTLSKVATALGHGNVETFLCVMIPTWMKERKKKKGENQNEPERSP